jgi:hypothetical protein
VFDSSAILLYLAEKTGKFLPAKTDKARGELLSWMFFVSSGVDPYFGQSVHFRVYAPEKISYATNRYAFEAQNNLDSMCRPVEIACPVFGQRTISSAMPAFSTRGLPSRNTCSATPIRSST